MKCYCNTTNRQTSPHNLRKRYPNFQQLLKVERAQPCYWIPTLHCAKAIRPAPRISTFNYIIQSPRISIQHWIDETYWAFANFNTLLVD